MSGIFKLTKFYWMLFIFVSSILLLLVRASPLILFIGWEGLGITSFLLIVFYQNWFRVNSGILTLLTNRIGDAILLLCATY